jgi:IS30 family transposase
VTIYQALYVEGRVALRRELAVSAHRPRTAGVSRQDDGAGQELITEQVMISKRPAGAEDRAVPGYWEADLIIRLTKSAIRTLVERTSRFTMLPASAADGRVRRHRAGQERPAARRARRRSGPGHDRGQDHELARAPKNER